MNFHTLSVYGRCSKTKLLSLILIGLISFSMIHQVQYSVAQDDQSISLVTDKNSYLPGDTVQLNGMVTGQQGPLVAIQIKDSAGNLILIRVVQADQNGNFSLKFKIPSTAVSGDFGITASARINGFVVTQTKEVRATVPEFGPDSTTVFGIAIFLIILFLAIFNLRQKTRSMLWK